MTKYLILLKVTPYNGRIWFLLVIDDFKEDAWFFNLLIKSLLLFNEYLFSFLFCTLSILNSEILISFSLFCGDVEPPLPKFENELFNLFPIEECPVGIIFLVLLLLILLFPLFISIPSFIFFLWYKLSPLKVFSIILFGIFLPNELNFLRDELLSVAWVAFVPTKLIYY